MMQSDETKPPDESANPTAEPANVLTGNQQLVDPADETKPSVESANPAAEPANVLTGKQRPIDPKDADDVLTRGVAGSQEADREVLAESRRYTRRAFIASGIAAAAGYAGYYELSHAPSDDMQPLPFLKAFQFNAALARDTFRNVPLAPTYPLNKAESLRVNGIYGLPTRQPGSVPFLAMRRIVLGCTLKRAATSLGRRSGSIWTMHPRRIYRVS